MKEIETYTGFEQGPIRPPSEAGSLLIRITRNCPWNRCTFCPVYKGTKFSLRPVDHVIKDIDKVHYYVKSIFILAGQKIKRAGMELSEYYMPGLGGRRLYRQNAMETADALNQINPDFIRLRTLALPEGTPLAEQYRSGDLEDPIKLRYAEQMCAELGATIENVDDIVDSIIKRFI
jgi:histone acetyltransferase (RNA polymerase elongator complex component)